MIQTYKQDSQPLQNILTTRKSKALDGFTPIENAANRLKIAEASAQASITAEVFLPHVYAAFSFLLLLWKISAAAFLNCALGFAYISPFLWAGALFSWFSWAMRAKARLS